MELEENIFTTQAVSMKKAADLLEFRINLIRPDKNIQATWNASVSEKENTIRIFKQRSIRLYVDTLLYLSVEILKPEKANHFFLLPHLRTLLDVYARFLHLLVNCSNDARQALTCITYQLLTFKDINDGQHYREALSLCKDFLEEEKFNFPEDPSKLDIEWIRKNSNLMFAKRSKLLTEDNIKTHSPYSMDVFGSNKTYLIYSSLSEFLHGNPYYYTGKPHNERFWVASMSISISAFLIELIDKYTLNKIQSKDFRVWLKEVKDNKTDFLKLWIGRTKRVTSQAQAFQ